MISEVDRNPFLFTIVLIIILTVAFLDTFSTLQDGSLEMERKARVFFLQKRKIKTWKRG